MPRPLEFTNFIRLKKSKPYLIKTVQHAVLVERIYIKMYPSPIGQHDFLTAKINS